jgi:hypothetical protein
MHPEVAYTVCNLERRAVIATVARDRLAAACGASRPSGRGGAISRLTRALIRLAAVAWPARRTRKPVPQP